MRILLLGATGFLGRHICARLLAEGYLVVAAVRDSQSARRRFPDIETVTLDMNCMVEAEDWEPYLANVDAVINCAGILQSTLGQSAFAIHTRSPIALFEACAAANVRRVIQISAVSADSAAGTEYALTKKKPLMTISNRSTWIGRCYALRSSMLKAALAAPRRYAVWRGCRS